MDTDVLARRLRTLVGDHAVITDRQQLRTYECDGLAHYKVVPALVVLAASTADVAATVTERSCGSSPRPTGDPQVGLPPVFAQVAPGRGRWRAGAAGR